LGLGFVDALGTDLDCVLDTLGVAAGDLAGADGHEPQGSVFVFCSPENLEILGGAFRV
jgi:hypothetical protein